MKNSISCTLAGLVLLAGTAEAGGGLEGFGVPSNMDFYGGGSAGMTSQGGGCSSASATVVMGGCDDSDSGYKVFAGARLKPDDPSGTLPTLGVEGGYINFGESSAQGDLYRSIDRVGEPGSIIGKASSSSELTGLYAAGTAFVPVAPRTELLAKAGVMHWSQKNTYQQNETEDPESGLNQSTSSSESGFGGLLGVGAQYQVTDNLSVRGEYERGFGVGSGNHKTEPSLLSVGAVFSTL